MIPVALIQKLHRNKIYIPNQNLSDFIIH